MQNWNPLKDGRFIHDLFPLWCRTSILAVLYLMLTGLNTALALSVADINAEPVSETSGEAGTIRPGHPKVDDRLGQRNVFIARKAYRQIFEPYLNPVDPIFITSDAVLSAYQVLMVESVARFEHVNANRLAGILKLMWSQIPPGEKSPASTDDSQKSINRQEDVTDSAHDVKYHIEVKKKARQRARLVIAVAMKLLGDDSIALDDRSRKMVDKELGRINRAQRFRLPKWIDSASAEFKGLDYSGFQPYGLYTRSASLGRYYRALHWLQSVPFRAEKDEELLAILMLGKILSSPNFESESDRRRAENFFRCYRNLLGQDNERDLLFAAQIIRDRPADLNTVREFLQSTPSPVLGNTSVVGETATGGTAIDTADNSNSFYIIGPRRDPDTILFQETTSLKGFRRNWPSGLEICAVLGSRLASEQLAPTAPDRFRNALLFAIDNLKGLFASDGLYNQYLNCLAALVDSPEPDAPAFMSDDAWMIKSCNTVLSGWVQMKKIRPVETRLANLADEDTYNDMPSGFVEPEPEFFSRLGELVSRTRQILENCGALVPPRHSLAGELRTFAQIIAQQRYPRTEASDFTSEEIATINRSIMILEVLGTIQFFDDQYSGQRDEIVGKVRALADEIEKGVYEEDPTYQALVIETNADLKLLWQTLAHICSSLEVMAHKQLRGISFNEKENYFLADFGMKLAAVMLYGGDTYRSPVDNMPIIVAVHSDSKKKEYLYGALARPRELIVLYPFRDEEILCRGAAMPYYEFISTKRLSDQQWLQRLESDERPPSPRWLKPIVAPGAGQKVWQVGDNLP